MDNQTIKCSSQEHSDSVAIAYCQECKINLCRNCDNFHSKLFQNHHKYNIDKSIEEVFTGLCKEEKHSNELQFYCKNDNKLCCSSCLSKIKDKYYGQHSECEVYSIQEIKNEKK